MKLVTTAGSLKSALRIVGQCIEARNTIPILGCVVIDGRKLRGTNLDMEIESSFPASHAKESVAIHHRSFAQLVGNIPADQTVTIEGEEEVTLSFDGGLYSLLTLPASDYPEMEKPSAPTIPATEQFNRAMRFASNFVSDEETRYYLNGVCLDGKTVVATNGHVLGEVKSGMAFDGRRIIPRKTVATLGRIGDFRSIAIDDLRATFAFDGVAVHTRLIDGTFPEWQRVVPKIEPEVPRVTVRRSELLATLKRVAAFADGGRVKTVTLALYRDDCAITTVNADRGTARERLSSAIVQNANDSPVAVSYDIKYLRLLCGAHAQSETLTFAFNDGGSPCAVTSEMDGYDSIVMPMRGGNDANAVRSLQMLASAPAEQGRAA